MTINHNLQHRLNQIPEKICSPDFLSGQKLAGEIGFWIFEYDPAEELTMREYINFLVNLLAKKNNVLTVANINLFSLLVAYLRERGFLERAITMQQQKGDDTLIKALSGPLHMDKFAPYLVESSKAAQKDVVFISGVGSVWPLLRSHNLLNSLHSLLGQTPVVLFYPGDYDGQKMRLFGKIPSDNYYRAFRLAP